MKAVVIEAKVPGNPEKGIKESMASVSVQYAETTKEAVEMFGEEAILSNALANWKVTIQGNIRSGLRRGEKPEALSARLTTAKMGIAQAGVKVDPVQAYLAMFQGATPDKQAEMLKELKDRASTK